MYRSKNIHCLLLSSITWHSTKLFSLSKFIIKSSYESDFFFFDSQCPSLLKDWYMTILENDQYTDVECFLFYTIA